jgi:hypothetical protein
LQTASTSLFGIGSQQMKCVKTHITQPFNIPLNANPMKLVKVVWMDSHQVVLMSADGQSVRYKV